MNADLVNIAALPDRHDFGYMIAIQVVVELSAIGNALIRITVGGRCIVGAEQKDGQDCQAGYENFVTVQLQHEEQHRLRIKGLSPPIIAQFEKE